MKFVPLNRTFVPLKHAEEASPEAIEAWGRRAFGAKTWPELWEEQRVVVLAEANSGKTEELQNQVEALKEKDKDGFFAAIEAVAENGFAKMLRRADRARFEAWKTTSRPGWFLLDSVDEARIREQSLEKALLALEQDLGEAYDRARLIITCRGTDWQGKADLKRLRDYFPVPSPPPVLIDADAELISVLDESKRKADRKEGEKEDILVVALTTLTRAQRTAFLVARGVTNTDDFEDELIRRGLRPLTERPGDLDTLVGYWKDHTQFGSLSAMTENAIRLRLREREDRPQLGLLSLTKAREGAERLAAAMTLSRKFTISSADDGAIPTGSLDPALALDDWSIPDRAALLDLGLFAPASFGRIRFHHRSAIEYLTASWFKRLIEHENLSAAAAMRILVNAPFGVATIAPSLRAAAGWLAADLPVLREYLIANEPLVLIAHGDPTRLPLDTRMTLLRQYGAKTAQGAVSDHSLDDHALWMFGSEAMTPALLDAWAAHDDSTFRFQLLRLIALAKIAGCEALLRQCALDPSTDDALRIAAARAMQRLEDQDGLERIAKAMLEAPSEYGPRLAPGLALAVFPSALSVDELIRLVDETDPPEEFQVEGFGYAMDDLYAACSTAAERQALLAGLARLCTTPPLKDFELISKRHRLVAKQFGGMLRQAIIDSDKDGVHDGLVALLSATARIGVEHRNGDDLSIRELLTSRDELRQRLIWRDVEASFQRWPGEKETPSIWGAANWARSAWALDLEDYDWLLRAAKDRPDPVERRVAVSALYSICNASDDAEARLNRLAIELPADKVLQDDLARWRTPRTATAEETKWKDDAAAHERAQAVRRALDVKNLRAFRERLIDDPTLLSNEALLAEWPGPFDLLRLTEWLGRHAGLPTHKAATEHALLGPVFSPEVEAAFIAGSKSLWRMTPPARPVRKPGDGRSMLHVVVLSLGGLNLEAMDKGWLTRLSTEEIVRAAQHACWADLDIPEWLADLFEHRPAIVGPVLVEEIRQEWSRGDDAYTPFLNRNLVGKIQLEPLRSGAWSLISGDAPANIGRIQTIRSMAHRLEPTEPERETLATLAEARLVDHRRGGDWQWAQAYLGLLFDVAPETAIDQLHALLSEQDDDVVVARAEELFAGLFGIFRGGGVRTLSNTSPTSVARLLRTIYRFIRREDDRDRHRIKSSDSRDDAETGRNAVLTTLLEMPGEEPYRMMISLSAEPEFVASAHRFLELARGMAESAAERPEWSEQQVADFERTKTGPIRTPDELTDVVQGLLDDLAADMQTGDASPRSTLETAENEYAVQDWLTWHLNKMAGDRFTAVREKEIASDLRPDISVTASLSLQELAIEVKHGEMDWTLPALEEALRTQLAQDYLTTPMRRRGILVISNHRNARYWWKADKSEKLSFKEAVEHLSKIAATLVSNDTGFIRVSVHGLDVSDPKKDRPRKRRDTIERVARPAGKSGKAPAKTKRARQS